MAGEATKSEVVRNLTVGGNSTLPVNQDRADARYDFLSKNNSLKPHGQQLAVVGQRAVERQAGDRALCMPRLEVWTGQHCAVRSNNIPRVTDLGNIVEPLAGAAFALDPSVAVGAGEDGSRLANGDELVVERAHAINPLDCAGGLPGPVSAVGRGEDDTVLPCGDKTAIERLDAGKDAGGRCLVLVPLLAVARR